MVSRAVAKAHTGWARGPAGEDINTDARTCRDSRGREARRVSPEHAGVSMSGSASRPGWAQWCREVCTGSAQGS